MTTLRRIGVGLFLSVLSVAAAALVDGRRLEAFARMSAWWTVPQYVLLGIADVYTLVGEQEFFYDQVLGSFRLFWVRVVNRTHSLKFCVCFILDYILHMTSLGNETWHEICFQQLLLLYRPYQPKAYMGLH